MFDHRPRAGLRAALAALAAGAALIAPAAAQAATETASSGGVTATFTYTSTQVPYFHDTLTIARGGKVVYRTAVSAPCQTTCGPGAYKGKSVHVLDLEHNGARDVMLDLYSGGAHCCFYEVVYYPSGSTYKKVAHNFADAGAQLADLGHNGHREFLSANALVFSYAFTDYAASGAPIQIWSFGHGKFRDVTRSYPKLIAKDANYWLKAYRSMAKQHWSDTEGVIADWAADEYMLGHKAQAQAYLNQEAKQGHLNALGSSLKGHRYVLALEKFLTKAGY